MQDCGSSSIWMQNKHALILSPTGHVSFEDGNTSLMFSQGETPDWSGKRYQSLEKCVWGHVSWENTYHCSNSSAIPIPHVPNFSFLVPTFRVNLLQCTTWEGLIFKRSEGFGQGYSKRLGRNQQKCMSLLKLGALIFSSSICNISWPFYLTICRFAIQDHIKVIIPSFAHFLPLILALCVH